MRLKSHIFVAALVRRVFGAGDFAAIEHKGSEEAGAIFVRQRRRDGSETLYAPAPQNFFEEDANDRRFEMRLDRADAEKMRATIDKELRFDPDLWLVEIEVEDIGDLIEIVTEG
jgi:hypothetical protein